MLHVEVFECSVCARLDMTAPLCMLCGLFRRSAETASFEVSRGCSDGLCENGQPAICVLSGRAPRIEESADYLYFLAVNKGCLMPSSLLNRSDFRLQLLHHSHHCLFKVLHVFNLRQYILSA